jgi:hypothetical protein
MASLTDRPAKKSGDDHAAVLRVASALRDIELAVEEIVSGGLPPAELGEIVMAPSVPIIPRIGAENVVELPPPKDTRLLLPTINLNAGTNA